MKTKSDVLKPCPFCGSLNITFGYVSQPAKSFSFMCYDCGACGPTIQPSNPAGGGMDNIDIDKHWNKRYAMKQFPESPYLDTENLKYIEEFHSACMTYSHDYGIAEPEQRKKIQYAVSAIFNHHILPLLIKLEEK